MFQWLFCRRSSPPAGTATHPLARPEIQLHIKEYEALRAEQRTRLDSANKIIHYSALISAAFVGGIVTAYGKIPQEVLRAVVLLVPAVLMPFALTQQNEEKSVNI